MVAESRIGALALDELRRRGHDIERVSGWSNGKVMAIRRDASTGVMSAAASAKNTIGYTMAL